MSFVSYALKEAQIIFGTIQESYAYYRIIKRHSMKKLDERTAINPDSNEPSYYCRGEYSIKTANNYGITHCRPFTLNDKDVNCLNLIERIHLFNGEKISGVCISDINDLQNIPTFSKH